MKKIMNRWLALVLVLCSLVGLLIPATTFAASVDDAAGTVEDYASFLANIKILEQYAQNYSAISKIDTNKLMLNFVRCGVERYTEGL